MNDNKPIVWASMGCKLNVGNYQSQDISIGISGVPIGTTPEELEALLEGGRVTINTVVEKLAEQMAEKVAELGGFR